MRCTECGYVYFHNTAAAVAGIIESDGGVLLTVRGKEPEAGLFDLPGGFVDYNESFEQALVREVREELGIDVEITSWLCSFPNTYIYKRVTYCTCDVFFICRCTDGGQQIRCSEEVSGYEILPADALPFDRFAFPSHVNALREYLLRPASG